MRHRLHMAGWASCFGLPRLLAIVLTLALIVPSFGVGADAHAHAGPASAIAELAAGDCTDAPQDAVCLICHANCGCHVGLMVPAYAATAMTLAALLPAQLTSDQPRPSVHGTRATPPPRL